MSQFFVNSGGSGGTGIQTIQGDTGSVTGSTVTIYADQATVNSGSTVEFVNSGTVSTLNVTDASDNTIIGRNSGNTSSIGNLNTVLGSNSLSNVVNGSDNIAIGYNALLAKSTGSTNLAIGNYALQSSTGDDENLAIGHGALALLDGGNGNTAIGAQSAQQLVTGENNCVLGYESLFSATSASNNSSIGAFAHYYLDSGSYNIGIGEFSGQNYTTTESSNISLNSYGVIGESNTLRIGQATGTGQQELNDAYICGINGGAFATPTNRVVVMASGAPVSPASDELGVADLVAGTGINISTSANQMVFNVTAGGFTWVETSINYSATAQQAIFANAGLTINLPPTAGLTIGATIVIYSDTTSSVIIQANTGQQIQIGNSLSTVGGTATTSQEGSIVQLVFKPSDTTWHSFSTTGNFILA